MSEDLARSMALDLDEVAGVVGVVLGGSRARGDALPTSDVDLGVYYAGRPDVAALARLASRWAGDPVEVGPPGSWGPWVDAGAWLVVDGVHVDWILRDVDRVIAQWGRARRGRYAFHPQAGHPLGFLDIAYVGELASGVVLADDTGELTRLRAAAQAYPHPLRDAFVAGLWEAEFLVDSARKGTAREDAGYVGLCLGRALLLCAHALHAHAGVWVTNEKGLVPAVTRLAVAPDDFAGRTSGLLGAVGTSAEALTASVEAAGRLVEETRALLG